MLTNKRKGLYLPYCDIITKILDSTSFNLGGEESMKDVTKIGEIALAKMRYGIIDGKFIQKPSKGTKRGMDHTT